MPVLSIIIPIYNVEKYLAQCLDSVGNVEDIEIILINDCTPDNSVKIAQRYVALYDNVNLIHHEENKGLGEARNTGIRNAVGKYLLFLDSDDYLDTTKLNTLIDTLKTVDHDQVLISYIRFSDEDKNWPLQHEKTFLKYDGKVLSQNSFKVLVNIINLSQIRILKRQKVLSDNIWFPNGYYEDILWTCWYSYSCKSTLVLDNRIYFYRQHTNSITGATSKKHLELFEQFNRIMELFKSKHVSDDIISVLENRYSFHTKHVLFKTNRLPEELKENFAKEMIETLESFLSSKTNKIKKLDAELSQKSNKIKKLDAELSQKSNKIKKLDNAFYTLYSVRFRYHPLEKMKAFRQLMRTYNSLKDKE